MTKLKVTFVILIFSLLSAWLYVSHTHFFSLNNLVNHNVKFVRVVSSYLLSKSIEGNSLEDNKNLALDIIFPSNLNLPDNWVLSSDAIDLFCKIVEFESESEKEFILYNIAHTAALYNNFDILRFLNGFGDMRVVFSRVQDGLGDRAFDSLSFEAKNIIVNGERGEMRCE